MKYTNNPVIIFGAGHFAKVALEIFTCNGVDVYGFLVEDKKLVNTQMNNVPVLGLSDDKKYLQIIGDKCDVFIAYIDKNLYDFTLKMVIEKRKVAPVNAISPDTHIASDAQFSNGNMVMPLVSILPEVKIGNSNTICSGAVIGTSSQVGQRVFIDQRVSIGSDVTIGNNVFIGAGAVLVNGITVGDNSSIGAGSVVIEHVKKNQQVFGNPSKVVQSQPTGGIFS